MTKQVASDPGGFDPVLDITSRKLGAGRGSELTGLNVEDVDLDARRVRVRRSMTQVGGRLVEGNPTSMAGGRSVPIPERLVRLLKAHIDGRSAAAAAVPRPKARAWA